MHILGIVLLFAMPITLILASNVHYAYLLASLTLQILAVWLLPKGSRLVVFSLLFIIWFFFFLFSNPPPSKRALIKMKEAESKQNLHAIQLGLERYAQEHDGFYPADICLLPDLGCQGSNRHRYPVNPFKPKDGREMRNIPFGSAPFEGEFTYLLITSEDRATGYYLLVYGSERTNGMDIDNDGTPDHVIYIRSSEVNSDDYSPTEEELTGSLPPLAEVVSSVGAAYTPPVR